MKKNLFFLLLLIRSLTATSQTIEVDPSRQSVSINTSEAQFPVVEQTYNPMGSAMPNNAKRITVWFEAGNGFFSTNPVTAYAINGNQSHIPFLLATKLYDTTKEDLVMPSNIIFRSMSMVTGTGHNSFPKYLNDGGIKIIPNAYDIVPGDTMVFAIAYKTYFSDSSIGKNSSSYKLYFFYNNNSSFTPLTSNPTFGSTTNQIHFCRSHNNETPTFIPAPENLNRDINNDSYQNCICFNIPSNHDFEKNVFVSLVPNADLEFGNSGSVYAVLTDSSGNILATDLIRNMPFGPAHDPNYIVQIPVCLTLPKKVNPFTYTVHFQNTGIGNATKVKVVIHLPKGMNLKDFNFTRDITKVTFAGLNYKNDSYKSNLTVTPIEASNQLEILFTTALGYPLKGTNATDPATNPETMGEVIFTINSTPDTDNDMEAYAEIFFLSEHPSSGIPEKYEDPVKTKIAVTKYKTCCESCTGCYKILWLCWWWWLIILAAILLIWFIVTRKRDNNQQPAPYN
jgi:uncharacterized repeat protein (TIGR01451 family)